MGDPLGSCPLAAQEAEGEVDALDLCEPGLGRSCRVPACVCRSVPQTRPTRSRKDAAVTVSDRVPPDLASVHPLDCVVWSSLTGPHAHLAEGSGSALRYPPDVSPFATLGPPLGDRSEQSEQQDEQQLDEQRQEDQQQEDQRWADLTALLGPGGVVTLSGPAGTIDRLPPDWKVRLRLSGVQMV